MWIPGSGSYTAQGQQGPFYVQLLLLPRFLGRLLAAAPPLLPGWGASLGDDGVRERETAHT